MWLPPPCFRVLRVLLKSTFTLLIPTYNSSLLSHSSPSLVLVPCCKFFCLPRDLKGAHRELSLQKTCVVDLHPSHVPTDLEEIIKLPDVALCQPRDTTRMTRLLFLFLFLVVLNLFLTPNNGSEAQSKLPPNKCTLTLSHVHNSCGTFSAPGDLARSWWH